MRLLTCLLCLLPLTGRAASPYDWSAWPQGTRVFLYDLSTQWLLIDRGRPDAAKLARSVALHVPGAEVAEVVPLLPDRAAVHLTQLPDPNAVHALGAGLIRDGIAGRTWPVPQRQSSVAFFDDQLIIAFEGAPDAALLKRAGVRLGEALMQPGLWIARAEDGDAVGATWALHGQPGVRWAEPDMIRRSTPMALPNDPAIGSQWHLENDADVGDINIDAAWDISAGRPEVVIGVLDDGFDLAHPEFVDKIVGGFDIVGRDDDPSAECMANGFGTAESCPANRPFRASHGTAVAGLAGARSANEIGGAGVCPDCSLYFVRLLGDGVRVSGYADAFTRAGAAADIMNNSWGTPLTRHFPMPLAEREAFDAITTRGRDGKGVVLIFGTGNTFQSIGADPYPIHAGVIAVAASTKVDDFACYSGYGDAVAIAAPSGGCWPDEPLLITSDHSGPEGYSDDDLTTFTGTSAAAPVVAGLAGLMLSVNPDLTAEQVRLLLQASAIKITADKHDWVERLGVDLAARFAYDDHGHSQGFGYGRIDAAAALALAADPPVLTGAICDADCPRCVNERCAPDCAEDADCLGAARCVEVEGARACMIPAPLPTAVGGPCVADCTTCIQVAELTFDDGEICTDRCQNDGDCPTGYDCRLLRRNAPMVCVPGEADCGSRWVDGACQSGVRMTVGDLDLCTCGCQPADQVPCAEGFECLPARCRRGDNNTIVCDPSDVVTANFICTPGPNPRLQCAAHADCPDAEFCIDGGCAPDRAAAGCDICTRCDADTPCGPNSECIETGAQARCLVPCDDDAECPGDAICAAVPDAGRFCVNPAYETTGICEDEWRCAQSERCFGPDDCVADAQCVENTCVSLAADAGLVDMQVADMQVADMQVADMPPDGSATDAGADASATPRVPDGNDDGGCTSIGTAPAAWPMVLLLGLMRRRRDGR